MQENHPPAEFFSLNRDFFDTDDEFNQFKLALKQPPYKSIRLNKHKQIEHNPFKNNEDIVWLPEGKYVDSSLMPSKDPNWRAGGYYVQEASSMLLANFIDKKPGQKILDLCAAPGGKTTLVASVVPNSCLIFANEVVTKRVHTLKQNILKEGVDNIVITQNQAVDFEEMGQYFDTIFVDSPCSGEGLCRKTPDIWDLWSVEIVKQCSFRQIEILQGVANSLKVGGQLIYSTCTFNKIENEEVVNLFLEDHPEFVLEKLPYDPAWGIVSKVEGCYHLFPSKAKGEGLFIATMRKIKDGDVIPKSKNNSKNFENISPFVQFKPLEKKLVSNLSNWLLEPEKYNFFSYLKDVYIIPKIFKDIQQDLSKSGLRIHNFGLKLGKIKGKDFVPSQDLALFCGVSTSLKKYDLSLDQAMQVIASEPLNIENPDNYSGWMLLSYNGLGLSWGKQVGERINTYFEKT